MGFNSYALGIGRVPRVTAVAGTAFFSKIDPITEGSKIIVTRLAVKAGATAHTLTVMNPLATVRASAAAAAAQKVLNISADPGSIAANDYCVVKLENGTYQLNKVASVDELEITFTDNFSAAVAINAPVFFYGVTTDGHEQIPISADGVTEFESPNGWFVGDYGSPMLLHDNNATNAGVIEGGVVCYVE